MIGGVGAMRIGGVLACAGTLAAAWPDPRPAAAEGASPTASACSGTRTTNGVIRSAGTDGVLVLADGREVVLAGLVPAEGPGLAAALAAFTGERATVTTTEAVDRYGRSEAIVVPGSRPRALQHDLIARGLARVAGRAPSPACARELLAVEQAARAERLGLWGDPYYAIRRADEPGPIAAERGRFTLIEGEVVSVRSSGGTIYVNFGRRWSEDFTVTIAKRNERNFTGAGVVPEKLTGRRVRIRGVIEERGGPWIEAVRAEQIEVLDVRGTAGH